MNILLVYPEIPSTFFSFKSALKFVSKKAASPPLGLITVAAMLPEKWKKKLIDMNVSKLKNSDLLWADYVFLSGMNIQKESFSKVVTRCNQLGVKIVAGGPMVTTEHENFSGIDHFVLNEAEMTLPSFLTDLRNGYAQHLYTSDKFPDISQTPTPLWELLNMKKYAAMNLQYSRGCPFNCEFCSITMLNGHIPRTKSREQLVKELDTLYDRGWRSEIFIVDDNFIGNKHKLRTDILPAMAEWLKKRHHPFYFGTETSINLADDPELMHLMVDAGFESVFIGIETPDPKSLAECGKTQNMKRDMVDSVKKIQKRGLIVTGGFIVGFDNDSSSIFEKQIDFIKNSGIVTAMVGLLNAPIGTRLFNRLNSEKRLLSTLTGDNMDGSMNFTPKMNYQKLKEGYKKILETIYSRKTFYQRVQVFLSEHRNLNVQIKKIHLSDIKALIRSIFVLGIIDRGRIYYWKLFMFSLFNCPRRFPIAIKMMICGFHFRRVVATI